MTKLGHTVKVFGASYGKGEKTRIENIDGIEYHITACYFPLQGKLFGQISHPFAAIKRSLKKYPKCDIAHVFQPHISAFAPWYFNRKKAKLNLYDWDDLWTNGLRKKGKTFQEKWLYYQVKIIEKNGPRASDVTTTCSHFLAERSRAAGAKKVDILFNGFWKYTPNDKSASRQSVELQERAFYLGFMGRTVDEIEWCFELLSYVLKIVPEVRLALCGMPIELIQKFPKNLLDKTDYLGFLKPIETRNFATALDIGLLPLENNQFNRSRFPIKFAEYLAAGVPILCTMVGECANIAKLFDFVKITAPEKTDWNEKGLKMIEAMKKGEMPDVDILKVETILSWNAIVDKLENIYIINSN